MRPVLTVVGEQGEPVASVPGRFSSRRSEPHPVERLVRDALFGPMRDADAGLLLSYLGPLDRYDEEACRRVREEVGARSSIHPEFNDRFVRERVSRVGDDSRSGRVARERWITTALSNYSADVLTAYRRRNVHLTPTRLAYLRALYVSCAVHRNVGPVLGVYAQTSNARRLVP